MLKLLKDKCFIDHCPWAGALLRMREKDLMSNVDREARHRHVLLFGVHLPHSSLSAMKSGDGKDAGSGYAVSGVDEWDFQGIKNFYGRVMERS